MTGGGTQELQNASNCRAIQGRKPSEAHLGSLDSRDSLTDAGNPAKEEKREEGPRGSRQAGEEAREVEREEGPRSRQDPQPGGESGGTRRVRFSVEYCSFSACKRTRERMRSICLARNPEIPERPRRTA